MAYESNFGNNGGNNRQEEFRATFYSPVRLRNPESEVDPSELSFRFWKGLLGIIIAPKLAKSNTEYNQYDNENAIQVYINHTKARMLYAEMAKLKENPDAYNSVGINSGSTGLISVSNGKEVGVAGPVLILRKLDQNGTINSSYMYEFNRDFHYSIRNFDESTLKYDKNYFDWIEYDEFMQTLKSFYENANMIQAFGVVDSARREFNRLHSKLNPIMEKMGIERYERNNRGGNGGGKSFFDKANQGSQFSDSAAAGVPDRGLTNSSLDSLSEEI